MIVAFVCGYYIKYNGGFNLKKEDRLMIKRGELYYADLSPVVGSEQGGIRPVLVVQNDIGNKYSPTVIAAAVTSKLNKARLPTHIELKAADYGLTKDSVVLLEQIRTLDKRRLKERIGELSSSAMKKVNGALLISLGFMAETV
ncbi:MAG: type II toxin-antitoxin system PemK/MazF family toxin [Clostridia bacterium]|nr:type II toxin-antitoxin system PemK/MazF family toxin [Clostridia bacterium]